MKGEVHALIAAWRRTLISPRVASLNAGDPREQLGMLCTRVQMLFSNVIMELVIHKATERSAEAPGFDLINCFADMFPFVRNVSGKPSLMGCVCLCARVRTPHSH